MRFVFGYAGVPPEVYDPVYRQRTRICGDNGIFLSEPLRSKDWVPRYADSHAKFFIRQFAGLIRDDHQHSLRDTGFVLVYVKHEITSTARFVQHFFPSTLCVGIDWALDRTTSATMRRSKNRLVEALKVASDQARKAIPVLKKEVTERDNRTPLLLPAKNFDSKGLVGEIESLQELLIDSRDKSKAVAITVDAIEKLHPMQSPEKGHRKFFVDDRKIEFRPPGTNRHAYARGQGDHPETCLLSGRRRLGAPYDHVFHFDCHKGPGNLRGTFYGCHEEQSAREGNPHLNIAPNDNVRG